MDRDRLITQVSCDYSASELFYYEYTHPIMITITSSKSLLMTNHTHNTIGNISLPISYLHRFTFTFISGCSFVIVRLLHVEMRSGTWRPRERTIPGTMEYGTHLRYSDVETVSHTTD